MATPGNTYRPPSAAPAGRAPNYGPYGPSVFGRGEGTPTVRSAAEGARYALDKMGVPSLSTLFGQNGGSGFKQFPYDAPTLTAPTRETAGSNGLSEARHGLKVAKGALDTARGDVNAFRDEYNDPTHTQAFQSTLALANSRTARDVEEQGRLGREAASRSGIVGGYDPERDARARQKALSDTAFEAAGQARSEALKGYEEAGGIYSSAAGLYGSALGGVNATNNSIRESQTALDKAFGDQTQEYNRNQIEKSRLAIDSIKSITDSLGSFNPGSFFETALNGTRFDVGRADELRRERERRGNVGGSLSSRRALV